MHAADVEAAAAGLVQLMARVAAARREGPAAQPVAVQVHAADAAALVAATVALEQYLPQLRAAEQLGVA